MNYETGVFTGRVILLFCLVFVYYSCSPDPEKKIAAVHIVEIKEMKFHPTELKVNKGDTVVWVNHDFFEHDITESLCKRVSEQQQSDKSAAMKKFA